MKKLIAILFSAILIISMTTTSIFAQDSAASIQSIQFAGTDVEVVPQGGATLESLIDGDKVSGATSFSTAGVVLFKNTKATEAGVYTEFSLTVQLDEVTSVDSAVISFYKEYNSMIGLPQDNLISVEYSSDGSAYFAIGDITFTGEAVAGTNEVQDANLQFDGAVDAAFLRFTFVYGDSPFTTDNKVMWEWMGLTEISVNAAPVTDVSDLSDTTSDTTPQTGDSSVWVYIVVAILAVAGISIIAFRRKSEK
ncbi:MAG: hypothetical protein A2Y17_10375 [Clostridiales bacterium GWF2_38_85]|nr:MAG: hypothetical protein A2Y17_10375 [Clostridiales bacterium GWF2_38_85]HBL84857.1 hypothetical protein [Clostridiales bacterium]